MVSDRPLPEGPVEFDEEGDPLPLPAPNSDLADLIQLLEFGRRKKFRIGPMVRVGKIALQVRDERLDRAEAKDEEPDLGIFHEAGYRPGE